MKLDPAPGGGGMRSAWGYRFPITGARARVPLAAARRLRGTAVQGFPGMGWR